MEFTAQKEQMMEPLQALMGVVERKQTFPILANVLLIVEEGRFSLIGTDLEVELITQGSLLETKSEGTLTVPAKKWFDVLRTLPEEDKVHYCLENNRLRIRSESARFSLNTLPPQEFPRMEIEPGKVEFEIPENALLDLVKQTSFSMAEQNVRHYLNGLFLDLKPKSLRLVASDGHRLSLAEANFSLGDVSEQIIVPRRAVLELSRLLQDKNQTVLLQIGSNYFQLKKQTLTFASKLIDAKFPPYQSLIPKNPDKKVLVDRDLFKQALLRVATLSNEKDHAVRFKLEQNRATLRSNNPEHEEAEVVVPIHYTGEDFEIAFNGYYLLDVLNVMQAANVELWLSLPEQGIRIQEENNPNSLYIVMPTFL